MGLHHRYFFILLFLAFVASHAATLSPEVYWKVKLPNTPMPRPIKDALHNLANTQGELHKLRQQWGVGSGYQDVAEGDLHKGNPRGVGTWYKPAVESDLYKLHQPWRVGSWYQHGGDFHKGNPWGVGTWYKPVAEGDLHKLRQPWGVGTWYQLATGGNLHKGNPWGVGTWYKPATEDDLYKLRQPWGMSNIWYQPIAEGELHKLRQPWGMSNIWYQPIAEGELHKLRQPWGMSNIWYQPIAEGELHKLRQPWGVDNWINDASKKDINENHLITPYFFETDLHQGKQLNLLSLKNYNPAPFLPRKVADSIPFSLEKIEEILNQFSIDKDSEGANMIKKTIKMCEDPAGNGEKKYCATSLESMVDFTSSHLGTNKILAISTEVEKETPEVQTYTIEEVKEKSNGKGVICHKVAYPYAVHFCHDVGSTRTFMVSMVGADGTKVNAVSVCHEDTASMNPKALPFQLLNVKPGDKPICHFTLDDQIALVPSQEAMLVAKT